MNALRPDLRRARLGPVEVGVALSAVLIWIAVRAVVVVLVLLLPGGGDPIAIGAPASVLVAVAVVALACLDIARRREHVLLANLGNGPGAILALTAVPPVVLELIVIGAA